MFYLRLSLLVGGLCALFLAVTALPDSGGRVPLPGPGISYGGIPYGSESGNVAAYYARRATSTGRSVGFALRNPGDRIDFAPVEQYLK